MTASLTSRAVRRRLSGSGSRRIGRGGNGGGGGASAPSIDNTPWIGDTGTVSPPGASYQWRRDGVNIGGATSRSYVYTSADVGPEITCVVNGRTSLPRQTYFTHVAARTGATSDLAACWDMRDLTAGAVTTFADRVAGVAFGGTVLCDTSLASKKTIAFNGTTHGMLTTTNVSNLNGARGVTIITASKLPYAANSVWLAYSPDYNSNAGWGLNRQAVTRYLFTHRATTANGWYHDPGDLNVHAVRTVIGDFKLAHSETSQHWVNGVLQSTTTGGSTGDNAFTGTLGDYALSIGMSHAGAGKSACSFNGAIAIYRRPLTWEERQHAELVMGYLSGLSVSVVAQTVAGIVFGMAGQSNSVGNDTDLSSLPATWPPADTAAKLKRRQGEAAAATYVALAEPVNGVGGTHALSFADAIIRDPAYSGFAEVCINPAPPISGSTIASWQQGQTNYNRMAQQLYTMKTLYGYRIGGLLWSQGEQSTLVLADANAYTALTQATFAAIRADIGEPLMRLIMFRLHPTKPNGGWPYWESPYVYDFQAAIVAADVNAVLVACTGARQGDNLHYTTATQKTHGENAAAAYLTKWPTPP